MAVHSISRILSTPPLYHLYITSSPPTQSPDWNLQSHNCMSSRQVKSFSNVRIDLLAELSTSFATFHLLRSPLKAEASENTVARKEGKRTLIKILWQPKEGKHSSNYIHHSTNPNPRVNLHESQGHVQVTLRHPQTYVSTWCNAWLLVTRIRQLKHKPFCLPAHSHSHQPPPQNLHSYPANKPTNFMHTKNYCVHSISRTSINPFFLTLIL